MATVIGIGVLTGVVFSLYSWWRAVRRASQEVKDMELHAALILFDEMTAAISSIDLALRDDGSKWLTSMSESRTLSEAWSEHAEGLARLEPQEWAVLSDAVTVMAPSYPMVLPIPRGDDLKRSLHKRRELLVGSVEILRVVRDR